MRSPNYRVFAALPAFGALIVGALLGVMSFSPLTPARAAEMRITTGTALFGGIKTNTLSIGGTAVSATAAELNKVAGVTAGTVTASKALVVDSNKDLSALRNLTLTNLDAGASGTAGSVDVFPTTASKGKLAITAADSAGNTTTTLVNASQGGARTFTIPDPGASASFNLTAVEAESANGAIGITSGLAALTKAGVAAMTLAAPTVTTDDGKILRIVSTTANAHTITQTTPGFNNAGSSKDVATFGGAVGDYLLVVAYQGVWYVIGSSGATLG